MVRYDSVIQMHQGLGVLKPTCQFHANALPGAVPKGHVGQPSASVPASLVTNPPLRPEELSILPPALIMVHGVHADVDYGASGDWIGPHLQIAKHCLIGKLLMVGKACPRPVYIHANDAFSTC